MDERSIPRFNHVALSVPADSLDEKGRAAILDFYGEVFGFTEMPTMTVDRELLVLRCFSNEQFVYIHASDTPMQCSAMEHFGMSVATPEDLHAMHERARKYSERESDVELTDAGLEDFKVVKLHNFYTRYRLPMMIEIQCFEWAHGAGPDRTQ